MIVSKKNLFIYDNLPTGGAKNLMISNLKEFKTQYKVSSHTDKLESGKIDNLFKYLKYAIFDFPRYVNSLLKEFKSNDCAVIYQSWVTRSSPLLRISNIPKIYICHEPPREFYDKKVVSLSSIKERLVNLLRLPIKWLDIKNVKHSISTIVIANSVFSKKIIDKIYGIDSKVIYPGIDLKKYYTLSYSRRSNYVISVGAINKLKNFDFLINILSNVDNRIRPELIIVGNGHEEAYTRKLSKMAKVKNVRVKIQLNVNDKRLRELYSTSKIFLYASHNEPFGLVVLEAMASGLPIIALANNGGYTEILGSDNSFMLNSRPENWANAIEKLLTKERIWQKMSNASLKRAFKYNEQYMNNEIMKIIDNITSA